MNTPRCGPQLEILHKIKYLGILKPLAKMLSSPNKRNQQKYCQFHKDHGHDIEYSNKLKKEIESAIRGGQLKKFIDDASSKGVSGSDMAKKP